MIRKVSTVLTLALIVVLAACSKKKYPEAPQYREHPKGEFPVVACYAFYDPYMTDTQFEWVKEAGFNTITKALGYKDSKRLAEMAARHDIPLIISHRGVWSEDETADVVVPYKDNAAVWGFSLMDEPNASQFEWLKEMRKRVERYVPEKLAFINLLPDVQPGQLGAKSYADYVEDYVSTVNPPFVSVDIYPVKRKKSGEIFIDDCLYRTMEVIRRVSQESGRPFWSFILANSHWMYPAPKEEYIRFSVFTALAYGAQGLAYFTYLLPDFDIENGEFSMAPIDREGNRTATWYMVRNVNGEVRNLADVFLGAEVTEVTQTGERIPEGTRRAYRLPKPFVGIESYGPGVTVSNLRNGGNKYLLIVSRDVLGSQKVRLSRTRPVARLYGDGTEAMENGPYIELEPGGYALYKL